MMRKKRRLAALRLAVESQRDLNRLNNNIDPSQVAERNLAEAALYDEWMRTGVLPKR